MRTKDLISSALPRRVGRSYTDERKAMETS